MVGHDVERDGADSDALIDQADKLLRQARSYPPDGTTSPAWIEPRILQAWVSIPAVAKTIIRGLDAAKGQARIELIRAGVNRKYRNGWRHDSTVAENLALMTHKSGTLWRAVASTAIFDYLGPDRVTSEDLVSLAGDPLDFYDQSEQPPEAVLLCAVALGVDESILEIISSDCATLLGEKEVAQAASSRQERISALEQELLEQRARTKELEKGAHASDKEVRLLNEEVDRLRVAQEEAGSEAEATRAKAERDLRKRAEEAQSLLEETRLEAERVPELEAQIQGLEDIAERLENADQTAREQSRLREQAEKDSERHLSRIRELSEEVGRGTSLPLDDAPQLIAALARPVGQAARHAADRLASGSAGQQDHLLLELASAITQMSLAVKTADLSEVAADGTDDLPELEPVALPAVEDSNKPEAQSEASTDVRDAPEMAGTGGASDRPSTAEPPSIPPGRRRRRTRFTIQPLGGAGEVGGSAILVRNQSGHTVLLDCGQRVRGEYGLETEPAFHRRIGIEGRLHALLISHAHIDHVGSIPVLHREQSNAQPEPIPIYMTEPTEALARIMLEDSAKIQQSREADPSELGFVDYGPNSMEAAYRQSDVKKVFDEEFLKVVEPARIVPIPDTSLVARFLPVAHVLGSCAIHLTDTENDQTLLYSGDLGPITDPQITLPNFSLGEMLPADLVIMESTYGIPPTHEREGRRLRLSGREQAIQRLYDAASHAHSKSGCVLLPAFSLGRTQELAKVIHQGRIDGNLPEGGEIYIAGMGEKIINEYSRFSKGANPWARADTLPRTEALGGLVRKQNLDFESAVGEVLNDGFCYVIASPAMLTSGWSRNFLENMVDDERHSIIISGYIPKHAGGIPHLHRLSEGDEINLSGDRKRIRAKWQRAPALSAHAPSQDLRQFADYMIRQSGHVSFGMVHGDPAAQDALAADVDSKDGATAQSLSKGQIWRPQHPA